MRRFFPGKQIVILAGYALLALVIIGHGPATLTTHFIGSDTGDSYEMARNAWYFAYALRQGEPLFEQVLLGYPDGIDGSVFLSVPLQYGPPSLLALVLPLALAYNLTVVLYMALNGWTLYWLARDLLPKPNEGAALLAGLVYMAFPVFQAHLAEGHGGLMQGWAAPLYVWALLRLLRAEQHVWRWGALGVLFFYLSTTGHILQAIYVLLPVTGVVFLWQLVRRDWRALRRLVLMGAVASGLLLVVLFPVIQGAATESAYSSAQGYVRYGADALSLVSPSFFHPVFDSFLAYPRQVLGTNLTEGSTYLGIVAGALLLLGIWHTKEARWWLWLAALTWLLSLGSLLKVLDQPVQLSVGEYQTYIPLPFALVQQLPGFGLARTPGRFNFALALAVAVLAGYGAAWLASKLPQKRLRAGVGLLLGALILFEYQSFWPQPLRSAALPQAVRELREDESIEAIFNVPYQHVLAAKDALFLQVGHQQPLIAGQITRQTPVNPAKLHLLQATLDPALLQAAGADIVIFHRERAASIGLDEALHTRLREQLGSPVYEDERMALYRVPAAADERPRFLAQVVTPDANQQLVYIYVSSPGWVNLAGTLNAPGRSLTLWLDDAPVQHWDRDALALDVPLAISQAGYYTLRLAGEPRCPLHYAEPLRCPALEGTLEATLLHEGLSAPARYEGGIHLLAGRAYVSDDALTVDLHWAFDAPRTENDVRFVHVVDENGDIALQEDVSLGALAGGVQRVERVSFPLAALSAGTYTLRVGWYTYPHLQNYRTDGQDAHPLGSITLSDDDL